MTVKQLIVSDFYRYSGYSGGFLKPFIYAIIAKTPGFTYSFWFRLCSSSSKIVSIISRLKLRRLKRLYGIDIPAGTQIGPGLHLGHGMSIVINGRTKIGKNANISHFVAIGTNKSTPATIGDNVYIGPNVCVVEDVIIGNNVTIGAGSVVVKNIPDNATAVGAPCKPLNFDNPARYILNAV